MTVLDRHDATGGERSAVADPVDLVDDRDRGVARAHEVAVQRVHVAFLVHRALRGHQRLADDLSAEHALPAGLGAATTIQVVFEPLEVEYGQKFLHHRRHCALPGGNRWPVSIRIG